MTIIVTRTQQQSLTRRNALNIIKKIRAQLGLLIAFCIFGLAYAVPTLVSAPSTILFLVGLAYIGLAIFWVANFVRWRNEYARSQAMKAAMQPTAL